LGHPFKIGEKMSENNTNKIPRHVAIILDGNGRWAKKRMMPRNYGHSQGSKVVEKICEEAYNIGIKYLTVYAFSTENWKRPKEEVDALMSLLDRYLDTSIKTSKKNNMRVRVIGDKSGLSDELRTKIKALEDASKDNTGLQFQVAINYGSRDEIIRAVKALSKDIDEGRIKPDNINEELFSQYLDTGDIPDPDLLIRTSGEQRLSNFLLWQLAYTEFYFTDVLWPDFTKEELLKAVKFYSERDRKFGAIS
jgi:undecaprenyl diphosphate synthase